MEKFKPNKENYKGYSLTSFTHSCVIHKNEKHIKTVDDCFQARNYIDRISTEIKGIKIGDKFYKPLAKGKMHLCEVVDFVERKSLTTGKVIDYEVYAKSVDGNYFSGNPFETSFASVKRYKANTGTQEQTEVTC